MGQFLMKSNILDLLISLYILSWIKVFDRQNKKHYHPKLLLSYRPKEMKPLMRLALCLSEAIAQRTQLLRCLEKAVHLD